MFIEYRGTFFVCEDTEACIQSAWLIAKNASVPNVKELVKLVRATETYGCRFAQHESAMAAIRGMDIGSNSNTGK